MNKMAKYYFLINSLPRIYIGTPPEIPFKEFKELLVLNLTESDLEKVKKLLSVIDLHNVRALWLGQPLDERGNITGQELEEALLVKDGLPLFLVDFLERYDAEADRLRYFPSLYADLFREQAGNKGFLEKYFAFERELRLILTALRAKESGRDIIRELQFEDPYDPFVSQILAQRDAPDYAPPMEYEPLKNLFSSNKEQPKNLYRALLEYRFQRIEEMEENEHFTLDALLGYLARLILAEDFAKLDSEKGQSTLEELSQYG